MARTAAKGHVCGRKSAAPQSISAIPSARTLAGEDNLGHHYRFGDAQDADTNLAEHNGSLFFSLARDQSISQGWT
ncbi:MAG: hypothetical protein LC118_07760 [Dehalococcoidia bacterium]|nr:hypothetical protein [Dehalococcoidia bacterium]